MRKMIAGARYITKDGIAAIDGKKYNATIATRNATGRSASVKITGPSDHGMPTQPLVTGIENREQAYRLADKIAKDRQRKGLPTQIIIRDGPKTPLGPTFGAGGKYSKGLEGIQGFSWSKKQTPKIKKKKPPGIK